VRLGPSFSRSLPANGTVNFDVEPGVHEVHVAGLADNCDLATADFTVTVLAGDTSVVDVPVLCRTTSMAAW